MANIVREGDLIKVRYTGWKKSDKEVFDTNESSEHKSLEMKAGSNDFIPGFTRAVIGMEENEVREVVIPFMQAYGPRNPKLTNVIPRQEMLGKVVPKVGKILALRGPKGGIIPGLITNVTNTTVTIDLNSPLAGEDLVFRIYVEKIIKKAN